MGHEPVWRSASVGRYRYQPDRISRRRQIGGRYSERQRFCRWRRCGGGGPHDGGGSHGGEPGEPSWLRSCNVTFSPGRIFAMSGPPGAGGPHGTPLHLGTRSRHRRRAPRGALLHGGGTGKSVARAIARCSRTGSSNPSPSSREMLWGGRRGWQFRRLHQSMECRDVPAERFEQVPGGAGPR